MTSCIRCLKIQALRLFEVFLQKLTFPLRPESRALKFLPDCSPSEAVMDAPTDGRLSSPKRDGEEPGRLSDRLLARNTNITTAGLVIDRHIIHQPVLS